MTLYDYIQWRGMAALVLSVAAAVYLIAHVRRFDRSRAFGRAFLLAVAAVLMSNSTWREVTAVRVDSAAEQSEAQARRRAAESREEAERQAQERESARARSRVEFAEDDASDRRLLAQAAGATAAPPSEVAVTNAAGPADEPQEYLYRRRGRQSRDEARRTAGAVTEIAEATDAGDVGGRRLGEEDARHATRLGRLLNSFASLVLVVSAVLGVGDYLMRFNTTSDAFFPLPLSLLFLDRCTRKAMCVRYGTVDRARRAAWLADVVRRGGTFLYFGEDDPLPGTMVPRVTIGQYPLLPVPKTTARAGDAWHGAEFLFETVWFNRGCGAVVGASLSAAVLTDIVALMRLRQVTHARARQTPRFVWDFERPPEPGILRELLGMARDLNVQLVFLRTRFDGMDIPFDEEAAAWPVPRPYPALFDRLLRGPVPDALAEMAVRLCRGLGGAVRRVALALRHPSRERIKRWPSAIRREAVGAWRFAAWVAGSIRTGVVAVAMSVRAAARRRNPFAKG